MVKEKRVTVIMEADLWDRFRGICRKKDLTASQVLRKYVRDTVRKEPDPEETETSTQ